MTARLVVLTGAGISADSGLATFRDAGGLWEGRRPEDVATPEAWAEDPAFVWRFYQERRAALGRAEPNGAHRALVALEEAVRAAGGSFLLVTQNVDDLHERAGSRPLHMHGELAVLRCERCDARVRDLERCDPAAFVPCDACGFERLRPDVVWFGEIPFGLDPIQEAVLSCTCFLAVGTSGAVYPAAGLVHLARMAGAATVVVSLDAPDNLMAVDRFVPGRAKDVLPGLVEALAREMGA